MEGSQEYGVMMIDRQYRIQSVSRKFRELYPNIFLGEPCYRSLHGFEEPCPHCGLCKGGASERIFFNEQSNCWITATFEDMQYFNGDSGYCVSVRTSYEEPDSQIDTTDADLMAQNQHLVENSVLWNLALNNMPNGFHRCAADEGYTFLYISDRFSDIVGYSRKEIAELFQNQMINMIFQTDVQRVVDFANRVMEESDRGRYGECIYRIKSKSGLIWVLASTKYVELDNHRFFQGAITDITRYILGQEYTKSELLKTELRVNQYKKALVSGADAIYEINVTQDVLEYAALYTQDKEYTFSDFFGIKIPCSYTKFLPRMLKYLNKSDRDSYHDLNTVDYFLQCFQEGHLRWQLEYDADTDRNQTMHLQKTYILTQDTATEDVYALVITRDITGAYLEKQNKERTLQQQKEALSDALSHAEQRLKVIDGLCREYAGVLYVDVHTDVCTPYLTTTTVLTPDTVRRFHEVPFVNHLKNYIDWYVVPEEQENIRAAMRREVVLEELRKEGTYSVNCSVYINEHIEHAQVRIVKINDEYEQIWAVRSIEEMMQNELARQNELREALEKTKRAEQAKTEFLFNMSHDIRTPMNAIIGFNMLAQKNCDDREKVLDALDKSQIASEHLLHLINEILEMARISNGKLELNEEVVSIDEYFEQIEGMFRVTMEIRKIEFIAEHRFTQPCVYLDGTRVMQVITNLLGNAMKFTKTGGTVWYQFFETDRGDDGTMGYEIHVRDTGIGMSEEFQTRLFDAFEREQTSTNSGVSGTGLGLSIAKNIADLMGGTLTCRSKLGEGTEFVFRFRAKLADPNGSEENSADRVSGAGADFRGKRILLAEDNVLNREIATELLSEYGFKIESVNDGSLAVERVSTMRPGYYDLVLMDIQMPVMDGYTAAMHIRHLDDHNRATIPIVAMTANAFVEDRKKAAEAGMNAHLSKPINVQDVVKTMKYLLK